MKNALQYKSNEIILYLKNSCGNTECFIHKITERRIKTIKAIWLCIQVGFTTIGGFLGWFLGGWDGLTYSLIVFVAIDYITGIMRAVLYKKISSKIGSRGIFRKVLVFLLVGIAHFTDVYLLDNSNVLRTAVIFFYLSNEGISILENATAIGLPIPEKLKTVLTQLHENSKEEN